MDLPRVERYTGGARWYDVLSGERPIYRIGRVRAIELLHLQPGQRVLDIGCGTGLNFPLLHDRIGPTGHLTGLDASAPMLTMADQRIEQASWDNVELVLGDAGQLSELVGSTPYDAVICTYSLSIIEEWRSTWSQALDLLSVGGRAAVVDLSLPRGVGLPLWPLARLACLTGGSDPHREPWRAAQADLVHVTTETHRAGHVVVAVGTKP